MTFYLTPFSCPESRICFKEKQSHGRSVLPR